MSTGQWLGAILGAVVGFLIGGWYGAVYGAVLGYSIGGYIDPVKPDVKVPGAPAQQGLQVMSNQIGLPIYDVLGTAKITGQLLFFGKEFNQPVYYRIAKGKYGISGYKYFASWALGICLGPANTLYTIFRDQDPVWSGELTRPESGGEATIQIEGMGTMVFYFGTDDQMPNTNAGTCLPDPTLNTGHRHLCWAFFDACFMNEYNRMPSMSFMVSKHLPLFDEATSKIETYDTNPAHALWHILVNKAGLPEEWLHSGDFLAVATTLFGENRGISILFDSHQPAQAYLESINNHVDNILRYGSDGKFHPKLIRYDYNPATLLPVVDESILLEEPTFSRRSWIDTINEVKVQYSEITERIPPWVEYDYDFRIYDMRIDGDDIFVCGTKDGMAIVARIDLASGLLLDYAEYNPVVGTNFFYGMEVDATDVYVSGQSRQVIDEAHRGIIQKRPRSNLSTISWTWVWGEGGANDRQCRDVCLDNDYVYGVVSSPVGYFIGRCKVAKSDGTEQWGLYGAATSPSGILNPGTTDDVYISKFNASFGLGIDRITKSDGATAETTYGAGLYDRGYSDGIYMWLGGTGIGRKLIGKINVEDLAQVWLYDEATGAPLLVVECFRALADDDGVYVVGKDGRYDDTPFYQKIEADGSASVWLVQDSLNVNKRVYFAFCQVTDLLYIGTFDQATNLSTIRRYNKSDGVLVMG